ncbi:MAG: hypothetical protein C5B52_01240 [Bacteroidetes bacterium]|nr:MAG: hypothetical protein C5B52_01240 [Bacteroidota bacterium]
MRKTSISILLALMVWSAQSQDKTVKGLQGEAGRDITKDPNDTIVKTWKVGGLMSATLNQGALSNWSAGGDKSTLSLNSLVSLFAYYSKGKHSWDNTLDLAYGLVNTTSLGMRKSDDRIDILSKYGYRISKKSWYLSGLFNFRTQFAKGYNYPADGSKVLTSDFMAPAYILLSPGLNYKPNDNFSVFLSPITAKWTIVNNDSLSAQGAFGVDPGSKSRLEVGAFASVTYKKKFSDNIAYSGRLDLFSNYKHKPQNVDLYMTNLLLFKITKLIAVSFSVDMIYDDDTKSVNEDGTQGGPKLQLKETLGVGLVYKFRNF